MFEAVRSTIKGLALLLLIVLVLSVADALRAADSPVSVMVTQRTPMETLAADGSVTGVTDATIGARFNLVSTDGAQITLQDAQGIRYRLALSSTDYHPATVVSSPATNSAPPAAAPAVTTPLGARQGIALSDLPAAVQQTIQSNSPGRTFSSAERDEDNGEVAYDVETTSADGEVWGMTVGEDGTLQSIEIAPSELPPAVQTAIKTQLGQGRLEGLQKLFEDGETSYLAGMTPPHGDERDFTFAQDGTLLSEETTLNEVPSAVQTAINTQAGQGRVDGIDENFDNGETTYRATITTASGQELDFNFGEDGTLLSQEVSLEEVPPEVQTAIHSVLRSAKLKGLDESFADGDTTYEGTMVLPNAEQRDFTISATGILLREEIPLAQLAGAVQATIRQTIGDGKILEVNQVYGTGKRHLTNYEIEGEKDGKPFDFVVGLRGRFLRMDDDSASDAAAAADQ